MTAPLVLRGLTIQQPWATAIALGPKRIENRKWRPHRRLIDRGLWLAIHAGRKWDNDGAEYVTRVWPHCPPREFHVMSAVIAIARVVRAVQVDEYDRRRDPWANGPFCWELDDVAALPWSMPAYGHLSLWELPKLIEDFVRPRCVRRPPATLSVGT